MRAYVYKPYNSDLFFKLIAEGCNKKMDMQASKEIMPELKVLTYVHHSKLVISRDLCSLLVPTFI